MEGFNSTFNRLFGENRSDPFATPRPEVFRSPRCQYRETPETPRGGLNPHAVSQPAMTTASQQASNRSPMREDFGQGFHRRQDLREGAPPEADNLRSNVKELLADPPPTPRGPGECRIASRSPTGSRSRVFDFGPHHKREVATISPRFQPPPSARSHFAHGMSRDAQNEAPSESRLLGSRKARCDIPGSETRALKDMGRSGASPGRASPSPGRDSAPYAHARPDTQYADSRRLVGGNGVIAAKQNPAFAARRAAEDRVQHLLFNNDMPWSARNSHAPSSPKMSPRGHVSTVQADEIRKSMFEAAVDTSFTQAENVWASQDRSIVADGGGARKHFGPRNFSPHGDRPVGGATEQPAAPLDSHSGKVTSYGSQIVADNTAPQTLKLRPERLPKTLGQDARLMEMEMRLRHRESVVVRQKEQMRMKWR